MDAKTVVLRYWDAMNSNDFAAASLWLAEDFACRFPQSMELIRGRENFVQFNANYPGDADWVFTVNRIVVEDDQVVTDVSVTDGTMQARAITFSTIADDLITHQTEYWPDSYPAPEWRKQWVETYTET